MQYSRDVMDKLGNLGGELAAQAESLGAAIASCKDPDQVRAIMSKLEALAAVPFANKLQIASLMSFASGTITTLQVKAAEEAKQSANQLILASGGPKELPKLHDLSQNEDAHVRAMSGLFTAEERKFLESIDPKSDQTVVEIGEDGKIVRDANGKPKTKIVKGQELIEAISILKAEANKGQLSDAELRAHNLKLYGHEDGPHTEEERIRGLEKIRAAQDAVNGHTIAKAHEAGKPIAEIGELERASAESHQTIKEIINIGLPKAEAAAPDAPGMAAAKEATRQEKAEALDKKMHKQCGNALDTLFEETGVKEKGVAARIDVENKAVASAEPKSAAIKLDKSPVIQGPEGFVPALTIPAGNNTGRSSTYLG